MIVESDIAILRALTRYYVLSRPQIQRLVFPHHKSPRATRKHLAKLYRGGYLNKHRTLIPFGNASAGYPVYYPTKKGCEFLASHFDDRSYLATNCRNPRADRLCHWLGISETRIIVDAAVAKTSDIVVDVWINEWEVLNKTAGKKYQYYLHTVLREGPEPLSCSPDAGFLLNCRGHKKVFYLEQDRGQSAVRQVAASKTPGYAELARHGLHRQHFPEATIERITVLMVTTTVGRRNRLAEAIADKDGGELWLFVAQDDLTPDTFLFEPITYNTRGEAGALIRR